MEQQPLRGVIEGFYGPPWSPAERTELLGWMAAWGLDTYVYAPKDDLRHRAVWREPYPPNEAAGLAALIRACRDHGVRFVYALGPGLDICFSDAREVDRLLARCAQMRTLGCADFALLFDDIPDAMREADRQRFGTFASAQCHVANEVFRHACAAESGSRFFFCPTPYCGRMDVRALGGAEYLDTVGRELAPGIDVFWTGPEIVSGEIDVSHVREIARRLRRPPVIWDNLFANDYDGRRFFCGPYAGRPLELRGEAGGLLCNPNTEFPLNFVPLRTFAAFLRSGDTWDPRAAYVSALEEWRPRFVTHAGPASPDDLRLFADAFYLPYGEGPDAEGLDGRVRDLLRRPSSSWGDAAASFLQPATRLRDFCARLADLRDRPLFCALHRRAWELREELDLLIRYVHASQAHPGSAVTSDFHQPGTYRGGLVARLQRLISLRADGTLEPAEP